MKTKALLIGCLLLTGCRQDNEVPNAPAPEAPAVPQAPQAPEPPGAPAKPPVSEPQGPDRT